MIDILGVLFIVSFFIIIITTIVIKRLNGTNIFVLGKTDKRELLFVLGYFVLAYIIFSNAFDLPMLEILNRFFWDDETCRAAGVVICGLGILGCIICTVTFWDSVRIGLDYENAGKLTTTGIYSISRNPMYTSFCILFFGEFLIFPNLGLLIALVIAGDAFHFTILREEKFLKSHYGKDYEDYCKKVRRYL